MRAHLLCLLLVICMLLASQAAPIDSRDSRELSLSSRKAKAAAKPKAAPKPPKAAPKPPKAAPKPAPKAVKAAPKPVKAAPKPVKAAPKPVPPKPVKAAPKPVPKPVKAAQTPVPKPVKAAPKPVKAAPKPVKAAPKPVAKPAKASPKPVAKPAKASPKPVAKPAKASPKPAAKPAKASPKPVAKPVAAPKGATTSKGKACPIPKKGSKAGVKARVNTDTEDCGASPAEICAEIDDCATCVSPGLGCAFDVKGGKCVVAGTAGLTLATSKKTCDTLLAAEQASAPPAVDARVTAAAQAAFSKTVQDHIFKGAAAKKNSGRHILSAWKKANPTSIENKRDTTTGVVEFQNGGDIKTVWNDVPAADGTVVYTQAQIKDLCLRGYEQSILTNPSNAASLKAPAQPAAGASTKAKGKATAAPAALKLTSGLNNGFVVHNAVINKNVCINVSSASCFPLGTGTASGAEGDRCTGDSGVAE